MAFFVFFSLISNIVQADRGSIPFKPDVKIFEPNQNALIAWNGIEEILILTTNLRASEATRVLEVIPMPSEPVVKKGDIEIFRKATRLINEKRARWNTSSGSERGLSMSKGAQPPSGEITFHKTIGAHDVSVARVLDSRGFVKWVSDYLKTRNIDNPVIPETLRKVIEEYLAEGFGWFVFDVVQLDTEAITNQAIQYRFRTGKMFYPLKISRTDTGYTTIDLLILTPKLLNNFPGWPGNLIQLRHEPVSIVSKEVRELSEEIDDLLGNRDDMKLRIWRIKWKLSSFENDLLAY